jgi:ubiquinone/menaquinone biosynthesis C-methylase UbiE
MLMAKAGSKPRKSKTQTFYDRIADVHNVALKLNGYRASLAKYLRSLDLRLDKDSMVLDAGSGTGIVTLGFQDAGFQHKNLVAFDISHKSLRIATDEARRDRKRPNSKVVPVQGNILNLPFADESFDLVLACGVLEYVDLDTGLRELSRVLVPTGKLVLIPVKPSLVGSVLELIYNFRIHRLEDVKKTSQNYFNIVGNHKFPLNEPIAWSKTIFLLEKKPMKRTANRSSVIAV